MNVRHLRVRDFVALSVVILLGASLIVLNVLKLGYTMR